MAQQLRIGTRGSKLALWQANHVRDRLMAQHPGLEVELVVIKTQGDKILDVPLAKIGGKALFVKEIEDAILDGRADLAVHSMKDVPTELPGGLVVGVTPERELPTDTLCSVKYGGLDELPRGALVGTASLRRQAQLLALRPDLVIESLRGNLDTRMQKLLDGKYDAIVLATSGLKRLGVEAPRMEVLGPPRFIPAVSQGALGIEYREDDAETRALLDFMNHPESRTRVLAERGFLTRLEGGCQVPIAGHAVLDGETVHLTGLVSDVRGKQVIRREGSAPLDEAWDLGVRLADEVLAAGGKEILEEVYSQG
ncbi:hydroxymethylbilane synthase [Desulfohalovibrio reitneri]|uniref:hydroxymethylbilane synthase n=1 Tax=Desulfohalovibrio reitneri TaxID=1307759 RepID=UPI0004A743F4|nr:hydroxymethylbilane synthase [Desulfohalovibrio reitneri]